LEYAAPITIGNGCWIASNVVICGGVTIGSNCVIGAGSVVTRDIPDNMFAAGSPCLVIREITKDDSIELKKNLW
jgi:maltose O-acetyltransferase